VSFNVLKDLFVPSVSPAFSPPVDLNSVE